MLRFFSRRSALACAAAASITAGAQAAVYEVLPATGAAWGHDWDVVGPQTRQPVPLSTYAVFTGVATAAGNLALLESTTTPTADDVVIFDGLLPAERINDYVAAAGSVQRFVEETDVDNGNGTRTFSVTVRGLTPAGGPGDLFPSGFTTGTPPVALTNGGFGLGLNLPDTLDLAPTGDPFNFILSNIESSTLSVATAGVFSAPSALPATFFGGAGAVYPVPASAWNGVLGISITNAATGTAIQDGVRVSVTYTPVPEPTTLSLVGLGAAALLRRRRA